MTPLVIDCTELYRNPVRTGVQRVVRELLKHWPQSRTPAQVVRFDPGRGLVPLPDRAIRILTDAEPRTAAMSRDQLIDMLRRIGPPSKPVPSNVRAFIPEVFFDRARCQFYDERQPAMLAYDFLPWLRPDLFAISSVAELMRYLRLLSKVPHVAFISDRTKREFETRIIRRPATGPVLTLGADGLRIERQAWHDSRRGYVALGSIDTRKNQHLIFEAFSRLWSAGHDVPLTLIGRAFEGHKLAWLKAASRSPLFRWMDNATDADVANAMRSTRATIYLSENEGFGLPPVESVSCGVPVIVAASCPSVTDGHSAGMLRLQQVTPDRIAAAVLTLEDRDAAAGLWADAAAVRVGTWQDFAEATATWVDGGGLQMPLDGQLTVSVSRRWPESSHRTWRRPPGSFRRTGQES
jgi:glycosyltransferase involved in cell wall biosynthesis